MEVKNSLEFYIEEHLSKCIEIPIYTVTEGMNKYIKFKGLLTESFDSTPFYVDGYLIIEEARVFQTGEVEYEDSLIRAKCSKYCSRPELAGNSYIVSMKFLIEKAFINYSEFKDALNKFGIPLTQEIENIQTKDFSYDVSLVNRKSNFTLEDAAKIAANIYTSGHGGFQPPSPLKNHYLELLSDCIKGTNQDNFKLHTIELWCSYNEESGESYSKTYKNGTYLKQRADLDCQLTIVSKQEFIRWCKYEGIDTGLTYEPKSFDESIELLKMELNNSEKEVSRLRDLYINEPEKTPLKVATYPPELQLAIDAFEQLCLGKDILPTNENIKEWLQKESKERGITHKDGSKELKGFSDKKLSTIPSIIKSQ